MVHWRNPHNGSFLKYGAGIQLTSNEAYWGTGFTCNISIYSTHI